MSDLLAWWVVVQVIGAVTFPIGFALFSRLPDRGYAFSKVLGLLFVGYLLWMGSVIGVIPNSRGSVQLILLALAVVAVVIVGRRREEIREFLRDNWSYVVFVEALFLATFLFAAWLRSYVPDLIGTEKPYEFAYLNSILRSEQLPPNDPWLSGFYLSYYYFGFVMIAAVIKLTGVEPSIAFNIALAMVAALTVVATFGVMYNLVAARGRVRLAVVFGVVAVGVLLLGNLEGILEVMAAHGVGPKALYDWAGIDGLAIKDPTTSKWYPEEFFWWWRSTRIPSNWDIKEYPFFSFLLGDLHPHVMVMPFSMLAVATGFNLMRLRERLDYRWALRNPAPFVIAAGILGSLSFLNAWSLPPALALVALAVFACNWRLSEGDLRRAALDSATFFVPLVVIAVLLYAPFYWYSRGGASWFLAPVEAQARPPHLPLAHMVTLPKHLFISWGPLFWLTFGLAVAALSRRWLRDAGRRAAWAALPAALPLAGWAVLALGDLGPSGFIDELQLRDSNLLTLAILVGFLTLVALAWARTLLRNGDVDDSLLLMMGAVGISLLLVLGTELFYQLDHLNGSRENTVFKLWHHAWLYLALGGAFAVYYVLTPREGEAEPEPREAPAPSATGELPRYSWAGVALVLVLAAAVFPLAATFARTNGFDLGRSLDGLRFAKGFNPQEMEAVGWLNNNVEGTPVILEAVGDPFTEGGRISSRTGLPTVLEWPTHQVGNRGGPEALGSRRQEVETAYKTDSIDQARAILEKYKVEYVIVGAFEKQQYGEAGLAKFGQFMLPVFQNETTTVYRLPQSTLVAQTSAGP